MNENNEKQDEKKTKKRILTILLFLLVITIVLFIIAKGYIFLSKEPTRRGENIPTDTIPDETNNVTNQNTTSGNTNIANIEKGPYLLDSNNQELTPEDIEKINFYQGDQKFGELTNLDIFKDTTNIGTKLIFPGLSGTYQFNVENFSNKNIEYEIAFIEENPKNVNMKFKLQRNGNYIAGSENSEYVSIQDICKEDLQLNSMTGDIYTLYWKWVDSSNDTQASSQTERGDYKLTIRGRV